MACPELLVAPLDALRLPEVADQVTVLPDSGEPPDVSVAVRVVEPPDCRVKVAEEMERVVEACPGCGGFPTLMFLDALPVAPPLSVTVTVTVYVPGLEYL